MRLIIILALGMYIILKSSEREGTFLLWIRYSFMCSNFFDEISCGHNLLIIMGLSVLTYLIRSGCRAKVSILVPHTSNFLWVKLGCWYLPCHIMLCDNNMTLDRKTSWSWWGISPTIHPRDQLPQSTPWLMVWSIAKLNALCNRHGGWLLLCNRLHKKKKNLVNYKI